MVWERGEEQLMEFIHFVNSIDRTINFIHKISRDSVQFLLDVIREGNTVHTDLSDKKTNTRQFLHFSSCHPFHTKTGIAYSQALLGCATFFLEKIFIKILYYRGYEKELVNSQVGRTASLDFSKQF